MALVGLFPLLILVGVAFLLWQLVKLGDDLNGWFGLKDRWKKWRGKRGRRNSPYIYVGLAVVAAYLLVTSSAARSVGWFSALTAGELAWLLARWLMRFWFVAGLVFAACVAVQQMRRRRHYMGGEPSNPRGLARAALRALARDSVEVALRELRAKGEGQCPVPGSVDFFRVTVGGKTSEFGLRVLLHMKYGMTIANVQTATSDGMDPQHDRLATYVNAALRDQVAAGGPEARSFMAYARRLPTFPYTAVSLVRTPEGEINPALCDLLLLRKNPLTRVVPYPEKRPVVRSLGSPILVGVTMDAQEAKARLRESHTAIWGQTRSGKTYYALNLAIGASQCPNVAFVVIDMKGRTGDLMSLAPRAAATTSDHEEATLMLEWLVGEMERRDREAGQVGKLTSFTAETPEIVVWADEWHEWTYDLPDKAHAERRMESLDRLARRAAGFGIYLVGMTQIIHAKQASTSTTGQFHNKVSTRLGNPAHSNMVFPNQFTGATGPHHIPRDWRGVAYGQFGEGGEVTMIRSLLSGPEVAARWARRDAEAGLNVPLPELAAVLDAHRSAGEARELVTVGAPQARRGAVALDDLPPDVFDAAVACWRELDETAPEAVTAKQLTDLSLRLRRAVENRKGATQAEKDGWAAIRETIRVYTHPTS